MDRTFRAYGPFCRSLRTKYSLAEFISGDQRGSAGITGERTIQHNPHKVALGPLLGTSLLRAWGQDDVSLEQTPSNYYLLITDY